MRVIELDPAKLLAAPDLKILRKLADRRRPDREATEHLEIWVGLPHRVLGVNLNPCVAEQVGETLAVERPARTGAPTHTCDAAGEIALHAAVALGAA